MTPKHKTQKPEVAEPGAGSSTSTILHQNSEGGTLTSPPASQETDAPVPRFLLVKKKNNENGENFDKVSPFLISKSIYGLIGETNSVRKVKDGLLINTRTNAQTKRLLETKKLADFEIDVIPHATLNVSKGVIFCRDLLNCSIEEIAENLKKDGVIEVRRMKKKIDNVLVDSANHILTFNSTKLPTEIKIAYYNVKVRPYIPPPTRCFNCQKFGHVSNNCKGITLCSCGKPPHLPDDCKQPIICVNCQGSHAANDKECPKYKTETAIIKLKVTEKIPYAEARRKVIINTPVRNISYSSAASTVTPQINFIDQIIPQLKQIICETINNEMQKTFPNSANPKQTQMSPPRYPQRTKRTRRGSTDSATSEATALQTEQTKRPKGRRRGRPRKKSETDDSTMDFDSQTQNSGNGDKDNTKSNNIEIILNTSNQI